MIPQTNFDGFYEARDFNVVGKPLVWTALRSKLTASSLAKVVSLDQLYAVSVKLDGKFVRVIKRGKLIRMLTSGSLDFYHNKLALGMEDFPDGQYNMEVIYNQGHLGDLYQTGYLTTAVTKYKHKLPDAGDWTAEGSGLRFVVHDYLEPNQDGIGYVMSMSYKDRRGILEDIYLPIHTDRDALVSLIDVRWITPSLRFRTIPHMISYLGLDYSLNYDPDVHEGLVFQDSRAHYQLPIGLTSYKVKNHRECAGVVVDTERNKDGGHGTLIVLVDGMRVGELGLYCRVSSGINDEIRSMSDARVRQLRVEVDYEQLTKEGEYTQPRIKRYYNV